MKFITTFLLIFLSTCQLFSQSKLDEIVSEFMSSNDLSVDKLEKLETIRVKYGEGSTKWEKAYAKWDKEKTTKSFNFEFYILSNDSKHTSVLEWHNESYKKGYTFEYLRDGLDRIHVDQKASQKTYNFIKNVLCYTWDNQKLIDDEINLIETTILTHCQDRAINSDVMAEIFEFVQTINPIVDSVVNFVGESYDFSKLNDDQYKKLSSILENNSISISDIESYLSLTALPTNIGVSSSFSSKTWVTRRWALTPSYDEYVKFRPFFTNAIIRNYFLSKIILNEWLITRATEFNNSPEVKELVKNDTHNGWGILHYLKGNFVINIEQIGLDQNRTNNSLVQLLIAAYNDVTVPGYFHVNKDVFNCESKDLHSFELSVDDMKTIDVILDTSEMAINDFEIAKKRLDRAHTEDDLLFQLYAFIAFKQRYMITQSNWIFGTYFTDPSTENNTLRRGAVDALDLKASINKILDFEFNAFEIPNGVYQLIYNERFGVITRPDVDSKLKNKVSERLSKLQIPNSSIDYLRINYDHQQGQDFEGFANYEFRERVYSEVPNSNMYPPAPPPPSSRPTPIIKAEIVDFPDVEASFPGGNKAMHDWIEENLVYPQKSYELADQGRVYVTFIVETDGSITGIDVMRGGITEELNREAKRLIRSMPRWTPGEVRGEPVRARCRLPIQFVLR